MHISKFCLEVSFIKTNTCKNFQMMMNENCDFLEKQIIDESDMSS